MQLISTITSGPCGENVGQLPNVRAVQFGATFFRGACIPQPVTGREDVGVYLRERLRCVLVNVFFPCSRPCRLRMVPSAASFTHVYLGTKASMKNFESRSISKVDLSCIQVVLRW